MKLIQIEDYHDNEQKINNESEDPSFYLVTLDNFEEFKNALKIEKNSSNETFITLRFVKSFQDKISLHTFLDYFRQNESVSLSQATLSCTIRGYLNEKKIKKITESNLKCFHAYLHVRCQAGDYVINTEKLDSINPNEIHTVWRIGLQKRKFYPFMRANLVDMLLNPDTQRQRELIVDLKEPSYEEKNSVISQHLTSKIDKKNINEDQFNAIEKVDILNFIILKTLRAKDYNLILGMPGTGKTYVIVLLLKILLERGDTILLSSYTHSAVDNILKRFIETFPIFREQCVRIASNETQVDEKLHDIVFQKKKLKSLKEINDFFTPKKLYAVTCLGAGNVLLCK